MQYPISELVRPSSILQIFPLGGASSTLDPCEAISNHIISLKGQRRVDNIFNFCYKFSGIIWRKRLLNDDLELLLPFKWNYIRIRPA